MIDLNLTGICIIYSQYKKNIPKNPEPIKLKYGIIYATKIQRIQRNRINKAHPTN